MYRRSQIQFPASPAMVGRDLYLKLYLRPAKVNAENAEPNGPIDSI